MPGFADVVGNLPPLPELVLWRDPVARSAAEAMAVDEALLEWGERTVLRIYRWGEPAVTYGYFDEEETARNIFAGEGLRFVRRWTGGGIVDHRNDIPFTLAMHRKGPEGRPSSATLYRWIHGALARVMKDCGVECMMLTGDAPDGGRACFSSPVTSDLVLPGGGKLAGGGQRRVRDGVLHQGSIQNCRLPDGWDVMLASRLADAHTLTAEPFLFPGMEARVQELLLSKYATEEWRRGIRHGHAVRSFSPSTD